MRDGVERAEIHSPSWKGVLGLTWTFARPALTLDWTGSFVGPMRLPEYEAPFERRTRSPAHSVHNLRAGLTLAGGVEIYAAANNLFDFTSRRARRWWIRRIRWVTRSTRRGCGVRSGADR